MNQRTYSELCQYSTFEDRFHYLQLHGAVGHDTFGFDRYLNQDFYRSREWRMFRDKIIVRDMGRDLGVPDHEITDWVVRNGKLIRPRIIIHHINPITKEDVLEHRECLLDAHIVTNRSISAGTIARTAVLLLALTNQVLSALGKPVLPIESAQLEQLVSVGITTVASLVAWWKNNSFTQEALAADVEYERQRKLNGK